jgi:hypothetical protein
MSNKPKSGSGARIQPTGHTYSGSFGSTPNATVRGRSTTPTEQKFGK